MAVSTIAPSPFKPAAAPIPRNAARPGSSNTAPVPASTRRLTHSGCRNATMSATKLPYPLPMTATGDPAARIASAMRSATGSSPGPAAGDPPKPGRCATTTRGRPLIEWASAWANGKQLPASASSE